MKRIRKPGPWTKWDTWSESDFGPWCIEFRKRLTCVLDCHDYYDVQYRKVRWDPDKMRRVRGR